MLKTEVTFCVQKQTTAKRQGLKMKLAMFKVHQIFLMKSTAEKLNSNQNK